MKKILVVGLLITTIISCDNTSENEEIPDGVIFEQLLGPPSEHSQEVFTAFSQLSDGSYIITGSTGGIGFGQEDVMLMKVTADGALDWIKSFGEPDQYETGRKVIETPDNGFLVIGTLFSNSKGDLDIYLIKTNSNGEIIWEKTIGDNKRNDGYDILPVQNGYFLLGNSFDSQTSSNDFHLRRIDHEGNVEWDKKFGDSGEDIAHRLIQLENGSLMMGGYTFNGADYIDIYLINITQEGTVQWEKRFDGPETGELSGDVLGSMKPTPDGGFIISGTQSVSLFAGFSGRAWILKLSEEGDLEWERTFGNLGGNDARGEGIAVLEDGYIMVGTKLRQDETDYYMVKIDLSGTVIWEQTIDNSFGDVGLDIVTSGEIITIAGDGYELEKAQQVYLMSFKNRIK